MYLATISWEEGEWETREQYASVVGVFSTPQQAHAALDAIEKLTMSPAFRSDGPIADLAKLVFPITLDSPVSIQLSGMFPIVDDPDFPEVVSLLTDDDEEED